MNKQTKCLPILFIAQLVQAVSLPEIAQTYQDVARRLERIPLYMGVRTDYQNLAPELLLDPEIAEILEGPYEKVSFLSRAAKKGDLALINQITDKAVSLVSQTLRESISSQNKEMTNTLINRFKKIPTNQQWQEGIFVSISFLCEENLDSCRYFFNKTLDEGFDPYFMNKFVRKRLLANGLEEINQRIKAILKYNREEGQSQLHKIIDEDCDIDKIRTFLSNKLSLVDHMGDMHDGKEGTALCYVSNKITQCNHKGQHKQITELLLKYGANPNCSKIRPPIYEQSMKLKEQFLDFGANPFISLDAEGTSILGIQLREPESLVQKIEKLFPHVRRELAYRQDIATVLGQEFASQIFGKSFTFDGGNFSLNMYKFILASLKDMAVDPLLKHYPEIFQVFSNESIMKKWLSSLSLAPDIKGFDEEETKNQILYKRSQFPVIIPLGWRGHAIAVIIYKDMLVKLNKGERSPDVIPGARIYEMGMFPNYYNLMLLKSGELYARDGIAMFDFGLDLTMPLKFTGKIEEPDQCMGNCAWESSASFAMKMSLYMLLCDSKNPKVRIISGEKYRQAHAITEVVKNFASYNLVKKYLEHALANLETNSCLPDTGMLTKILKSEVLKASATEKEDVFQQHLLSAILNSGLPLQGFNREFPPQSKELKYLFKKLHISGELTEKADLLYDIYDPRGANLIGKSTYPWGECIY